MTNFPETIEIQLVDKKHNKPIEGIVLMVHLFANHKNDYYIYSSYSDNEGKIFITKKQLEFEIDIDRNMFIMDYSSNLSDCKPLFEIEVFDENMVKQKIDIIVNNVLRGYSKGTSYYDYALNCSKLLKKCSNYKVRYKKIIVDIEQSLKIQKVILVLEQI